MRTWHVCNKITRNHVLHVVCTTVRKLKWPVAPQVQSSVTAHTTVISVTAYPYDIRKRSAANALVSCGQLMKRTATSTDSIKVLWDTSEHDVGFILDGLPPCDSSSPRCAMASRLSVTYRGFRVLMTAAWLPCNLVYRKAPLLTL